MNVKELKNNLGYLDDNMELCPDCLHPLTRDYDDDGVTRTYYLRCFNQTCTSLYEIEFVNSTYKQRSISL